MVTFQLGDFVFEGSNFDVALLKCGRRSMLVVQLFGRFIFFQLQCSELFTKLVCLVFIEIDTASLVHELSLQLLDYLLSLSKRLFGRFQLLVFTGYIVAFDAMQFLFELCDFIEVPFVHALQHFVVTSQLCDYLQHGLLVIIHRSGLALLTLSVKHR